ncbi:MAG: agmatinase [Rhodospirillales bacterium]|nr:agmatinase [Rhodospirillales bacterium]
MRFLPPEKGFLGLDPTGPFPPDQARAVIIPFGLEESVTFGGGTSAGPQAIIDASPELELFDEELWCEPCREYGIATLDTPPIAKTIEAALEQLDGLVEDVLAAGKFPLVLGGEHSLTPGAIRPFVRRHPDLTLLHFDAHADLRDGYRGEHFSHASAIRRCLDNPGVSVVSLGIRNISASEMPFFDKAGDRVRIYWAKDKRQWNADEIVSHLAGKTVYLTFDVDGFDASLMPATGTPEPGGIFWDEAMDVIRAASKVCNIIGADVVELAPIKGFHSCDFIAAKLAYKILSYSLLGGKSA